MKTDRHITQLAQGDHACLIYRDAREQMANAAPFVDAALRRGERCVYISDDRTTEEVAALLRAASVEIDVDPEQERRRGAFLLFTKRDAYLRTGTFDPAGMVAFLKQATEQALADGFQGLCVTGEMTWALGPEPGCERLIEYERLVDEFFPGSRALALCQYNQSRFSDALLHDVLRTHPTRVVENTVCRDSPSYQSPAKPKIVTGLQTGRPAGRYGTDSGRQIPTSRQPDDVALFPERDAAGRILVWGLMARGIARWASEWDHLLDEGRRLARNRQVSLSVVVQADSRRGGLIESYRRGPWRRQHTDPGWRASVLRQGDRYAVRVITPDGQATFRTTHDSLLEALDAADRAVPAHDCLETCKPWWVED